MDITYEGQFGPSTFFSLSRQAYASRFSGQLLIFNRRARLVLFLDHGLASPGLKEISLTELPGCIEASFHWPEVCYRLEANSSCENRKVGVTLPNLVLGCIRCMEDLVSIRDLLGSTSRKVILATDPFFRFQKLNLNPQEGYVLSRLEVQSSLHDIMNISALPELDTLRALLAFLATGIIEIIDNADQARVLAQDIRPEAVVESGKEGERTEQEMYEEVSAALLHLEGTDYYHILGVSKEALADQIKRAYFALAKKYHPDKYYFTNNPGLAEKGSKLFTLITQAYQTLSDASQRMRYLRALQKRQTSNKARASKAAESPAVPNLNQPLGSLDKSHMIKVHGKSAIAAKRFQSGKRAMQCSDFNEALEHLREAVRLEPNVASYQFVLGQILSRIPQRTNEALERLETAVKQDPENWEYRYALGKFYKEQEQMEKAAIQFHEVQRLNPNLHIASMEGEKESPFRRLFKKHTST